MRYLFITLILFINSGQAWSGVCNSCKFEINAASNFCPNCGLQFSLQLSLTTSTTKAGTVTNIVTDEHIDSETSTNDENKTSLQCHVRTLLEQARKQGRFSKLWHEIVSICEYPDHKNKLFFLYARAVALRNMGRLIEALKVLNLCLAKIELPEKNPQALQVYYELSFVNSLMNNHNNAVFYYYLFFINREESGIDPSTVNYAVNSAFIVMSYDFGNAGAYNLLLYCWNNLKHKINYKNHIKMNSYGFN